MKREALDGSKRGHIPPRIASRALAVGGDLGREVLDAAGAAVLAQDVAVQRVAASALALRGQQEAAFLRDAETL